MGDKGRRENKHLLARSHSQSERSKLLSLKKKKAGEKEDKTPILWSNVPSIWKLNCLIRKASSECILERDYYRHQNPFTLSGRPAEHLGGDLEYWILFLSLPWCCHLLNPALVSPPLPDADPIEPQLIRACGHPHVSADRRAMVASLSTWVS